MNGGRSDARSVPTSAENAADRHHDRACFAFADDRSHFDCGRRGVPLRGALQAVADWMLALRQPSVASALAQGAATLRDELRHLLNQRAGAVLLARSASEALALVARRIALPRGAEVLTTTLEHPAVEEAFGPHAVASGARLVKLPLSSDADSDRIASTLLAHVTSRTRVVCLSHVTWETGRQLPLRKLLTALRARGVLTVVDGAQAVGMVPVDLAELACAAYCAAGHKWLSGPLNTGFACLGAAACEQLDAGGSESGNDEDLRCQFSLEETAAILGLVVAVRWFRARGLTSVARTLRAASDRLRAALAEIPGLRLLSLPRDDTAPGITTFTWPAARPDEFVQQAHAAGIVLRSVQRPQPAVRVCLHVYSRPSDVLRLLALVRQVCCT